MANPLARYGVSDQELARQIAESAEVDAALQDEAKDVVAYWKGIAPVDEGDYAASVKVLKKARNGKTVVGTEHWKAHMIEFGTGPDTKTGSFLGPNTPTPRFACAQKTAEHFGGNVTGLDVTVD